MEYTIMHCETMRARWHGIANRACGRAMIVRGHALTMEAVWRERRDAAMHRLANPPDPVSPIMGQYDAYLHRIPWANS